MVKGVGPVDSTSRYPRLIRIWVPSQYNGVCSVKFKFRLRVNSIIMAITFFTVDTQSSFYIHNKSIIIIKHCYIVQILYYGVI